MPAACEGLRVLEFGWGMPVALAGMVLADNGAEVIKVEPPGGDPLRGEPAFLVWNRGKKSVALNLKRPADREKARVLSQTADVVLAAFRPGTAERLGIGYEALSADNPRLVYCAISGFGLNGSYARLTGYDAIVAAKAGIFHEFSGVSPRPGPAFDPVPMASFGASQAALHGVLAALHMRCRTGRGQLVEASLLQGLIPPDYFEWLAWQLRRRDPDACPVAPMLPARMGWRERPVHPPSFTTVLAYTKDGRWIQFSGQTAEQFGSLIHALDLDKGWRSVAAPDWTSGQHAMDVYDEEARDWLWETILRRVREKTLAEWTEIFIKDDNIGFEALRTTQQAMQHPQVLHNGHVVAVVDPVVGRTKQVGPLVAMAETPAQIGAPAPALGQHNAEFEVRRPDRAVPTAGRRLQKLGNSEPWTPKSPLAGVTVLDMGFFFAAPYGTTLLADLGARVIKVEPAAGDPMRTNYPVPAISGAKAMQGKESIALDVKTEEGRTILGQLVAKADLFLHNFRPGVAQRLGIDYETLRAINPRLVYLHATGYGASGSYAARPMYALTATAVNGNLMRQLGTMLPPTGTPLTLEEVKRLSLVLRAANRGDGDSTAAQTVATALLLGLVARERTGQGQPMLTSMVGANTYINSDDFLAYAGKPPRRLPDPELQGLHALYRLYRAREGWVFLAAPQEKEWRRLCHAVGRDAWTRDRRFATPAARRAHDQALARALARIFREQPAGEWERCLTEQNVACVEVYQDSFASFANTDPALRAAGFVVEVQHPVLGKHLRHGQIVKLREAPARLGAACEIGQHTRAILRELGHGDAETAALRAKGVVRWPDD
jgi:crotonobetainyl-CoA:carnitine CoA-transferase CaiB-like acyl-CoA transferase